jgi:hypothetical protein
MDSLPALLSSAGVAAVVSAVLTYLFKPLLEAKLQRSLSTQLEATRAEYAQEHEYVKELIKNNSELYPGLVESVYRSRNIARELYTRAPKYDPVLRAELGNLALAVTEGLFRSRVFLPRQVFEAIHDFKRRLQQFVFDYDLLTQGTSNKAVSDSLRECTDELDRLYEEVVSLTQRELKIQNLPLGSFLKSAK